MKRVIVDLGDIKKNKKRICKKTNDLKQLNPAIKEIDIFVNILPESIFKVIIYNG